MEKPSKQPRLSYGGASPASGLQQQQQQPTFHHQHNDSSVNHNHYDRAPGITEEELCELLREETCGNASDGRFLHWLSDYLGGPSSLASSSHQPILYHHLSPATLRQLHGWLILQLGCCDSFSSSSSTSASTAALILNCLRIIYSTHSISALLNPQELDETLQAHMRQVTRIIHYDHFQEDDNSNQSPHSPQQQQSQVMMTINPCLYSIDSLLDAQLDQAGRIRMSTNSFGAANENQLKDFILGLVAMFQSDNADGTYAVNPPARQLLLKLANHKNRLGGEEQHELDDSIGHWARIALQEASRGGAEPNNVNGNGRGDCYQQLAVIQQRYQTQSEWLFHLECRAHITTAVGHFSAMEDELNELSRLAMGEQQASPLAERAARCLAKIARQTGFDATILVKVVTVFLIAEHHVKTRILPGLWSGTGSSSNRVLTFLLESDEQTLKSLVSTLVDLILFAPGHGHFSYQVEIWRYKAACLLCEVLTRAGGKSSTSISHQDILSICFVFLENTNPEAMECAVDTLYNLVDKLYLSDANSSALFQGLAAPLLATSAKVVTKQKALNLYTILTKRRPSNLSYLARQPKVMEGLVRSASSQQRSSALLRNDAVAILLHMAQDPSNHRIMAKQTGLLSLLIRYVRDEDSNLLLPPAPPSSPSSSPRRHFDHGATAIASPPNREVIKENIMHIAAAL